MTIPDLYQNQVLPTGMATTWVESLSSILQMTQAMLEAEAGTEHLLHVVSQNGQLDEMKTLCTQRDERVNS